MSQELDRLIDVLLAEEIGREEPPDVSERVLARAFPRNRSVRRQIALIVAGLAASVISMIYLSAHRYPSPVASGAYKLEGAATIGRGAVLVTDDQPAAVNLGGYCRVAMEPRSRLQIEGNPGAEQVFLQKGAVKCEIDSGIGAFAVRTPAGLVSVTGTRFSVGLSDGPVARHGASGGSPIPVLTVAVSEGNVRVDHDGQTAMLAAGSRQVFGEETPHPLHPPVKPPRPPASRPPSSRSPLRSPERRTLVGLVRAIGHPTTESNPSLANATLTVNEGGVATVYYVRGSAGLILGIKGNGRRAEVCGFISEQDGKRTITGKSSDVTIPAPAGGKR